jgi:hypothetical protein
MTALAEPEYFDVHDEDYRSELDSRYEEGFGRGPELDDDFGSDYELDKLFDGLFDDEDDVDAPAETEKKTPTRKPAPKAAAAKTGSPKKASSKTMPAASPVISRKVEPVAVPAGEKTQSVSAVEPAVVAPPVVEPAVPAPAAVEPASSAEASAEKSEAPAVPDSPFFAPHIAPVNEYVEFLRKLRPGFEVPYVDPMHSVEDCRIVTLFSNTSEASTRGVVWAGDDTAATRLLGLQFQLGLRPEWMMPWNTHPWFTPGEANGKLTPEQVAAGLKPLIAFLKLVPRASAIVAHGTEANRLAQMLLKTDNQLIWRRGLKVYKARSLHGRAFAGSKERQTEWLIEMGRSYADAMARAGLQTGRR